MYGIDSTPDPTVSFFDPFGEWPVEEILPPPDWLLTIVVVIFFAAALTIAVLLVMWGIARRKSAATLAARRADTTWVDLNDFDPKADPRQPKSPKVVREDDINRKSDGKT